MTKGKNHTSILTKIDSTKPYNFVNIISFICVNIISLIYLVFNRTIIICEVNVPKLFTAVLTIWLFLDYQQHSNLHQHVS